MRPDRIAELLKPFLSTTTNGCHSEPGQRPGDEPAVLSATQLQSISTYIDILQHWNTRINLTAIRNEEEIVTRHFGESLFAASRLFPRISSAYSASSAVKAFDIDVPEVQSPKPEVRLADLGSGAGFPGIPIKLWAPNISVTLIESNHKKSTFLKEVVRGLTLTDINIQNARAETLPPATFDAVILRAVERPSEILPVAAALLARNGRLALLISSSQMEKTRQSLPKLSWAPPVPIPQSQSRVLLIGTQELRKSTSGTS